MQNTTEAKHEQGSSFEWGQFSEQEPVKLDSRGAAFWYPVVILGHVVPEVMMVQSIHPCLSVHPTLIQSKISQQQHIDIRVVDIHVPQRRVPHFL